MTSWNGGECPTCHEFTPRGSVRCRYCHCSLEAGVESAAVESSDLKPETNVVRAGEEWPAPLETIPDDMLVEASPTAHKPAKVPVVPEARRPVRQEARTSEQVATGSTSRSNSTQSAPKVRTKQTPTLKPAKETLSPTVPAAATGAETTAVSSDSKAATSASTLLPMNQQHIWQTWKWACVVLMLAPLCVSGPVPGARKPLSFGLPMVHSGDEPHYLVMINSVISDGDLDLANNYLSVHRGSQQAGRKFAGWAIDHHINWYWQTHLIQWWNAYENQPSKWDKDSAGHPIPTLRKDSIHRPVSPREYSQHPPGVALILAPILLPFRNTSLVEPAALLCSSLATLAGLLAFVHLVRPYTRDNLSLIFVTTMAYFGSPLWHYGRNLFAESFLACFTVVAYALALRNERYFTAGIFIAAGVLLKAPFALLAAPLIVDALLRRKWEHALRCLTPVVLGLGLVLLWNKQMHGDWLKFPQKWAWGFPLEGLFGLIFSWKNGLLLFSPIVALSAVAYREWYRRYRRDAVLLTSATLIYFCLMASWIQWWGGTCYSSRLILPIVPFLYIPLAVLFDLDLWRTQWRIRGVTICLMVASVGFGAIAAFSCEHIWGKHPLQMML